MPPLELLLQQAFNGLMLGVMYALIAVGFTLFFGVLDVIHFSHGDIFMLGAFAGLSVLAGLHAAGIGGGAVALALAFLASILITGLVGVAAERVCVKPLARSSPLMTLLATLSLGLVIRESVLIFYPRGADPKRFPQLLPQGGFELGGVSVRYENLAILAIGFCAMVAVDLIINRTRMGAAIRAVAQDPEAAQMMGVNLDRTVDATFFIGSGLAAVAGILSGLYYGDWPPWRDSSRASITARSTSSWASRAVSSASPRPPLAGSATSTAPLWAGCSSACSRPRPPR